MAAMDLVQALVPVWQMFIHWAVSPVPAYTNVILLIKNFKKIVFVVK